MVISVQEHGHGGDIYRNHVSMDFSVNINPLGMPDTVRTALYDAVEKSVEYPDMMAEKLKGRVSSMLSVPRENLLFGNGASELFMAIVHGLQPKKTVIPVPSFYGYEYAAKAALGNIIYYPLKERNDFLPDKDFLKALSGDVDMLFLANPNNPTGMMMPKETLEELLSFCREQEIWVVLDECFIEFCGNQFSMMSQIEQYPNLMLVRAFTKIFAIPGVRLGYLACSNQLLVDRISKQLPEWNLSVFAQAAGCACAKQSEWMKRTVDYVRTERQFLAEHLRLFGVKVFASEVNFLLVYSEKRLYEELLPYGILIRDCENFRGLTKGYYRIAVRDRKNNEALLAALGRLA